MLTLQSAPFFAAGQALRIRHTSISKVLIKLFQKFAGVQRRGASGRAPQSAKHPIIRRSSERGNRAKRSSGSFCRGGSPAIEGSSKRIAERFTAPAARRSDASRDGCCGRSGFLGRGAPAGDFLRARLAKLSHFSQRTPRGGFFGVASPNAEARRKHNTKHKRVLTLQSAPFFAAGQALRIRHTSISKVLIKLFQMVNIRKATHSHASQI